MIPWRDLNGRVVRVLSGTALHCGCVVGVYETYAGTTVAIIDEVGPACGVDCHRKGRRVGVDAEVERVPPRWAS
jgi:hypothetical protein